MPTALTRFKSIEAKGQRIEIVLPSRLDPQFLSKFKLFVSNGMPCFGSWSILRYQYFAKTLDKLPVKSRRNKSFTKQAPLQASSTSPARTGSLSLFQKLGFPANALRQWILRA